jgi:hypothetical protein
MLGALKTGGSRQARGKDCQQDAIAEGMRKARVSINDSVSLAS